MIGRDAKQNTRGGKTILSGGSQFRLGGIEKTG